MMLPSPIAEPGTRKLSEVTRRVVAPASIVDSAWFDLERTFVQLGISFDSWQDGAGQLILGLDSSGKYASSVGGACLCLPRQVGKTYLIGFLVFALCKKFPGLLVLWTAHHGNTATETFSTMFGMSQRVKIRPHVRKTFNSDNHKEIIFRNSSRILFGARARGFGRGIPGVDVLVFDEAQNLPESALDDMISTLNTAPNGLPIFLGTPPTPRDASEFWLRKRARAASGESDDGVWIECGGTRVRTRVTGTNGRGRTPLTLIGRRTTACCVRRSSFRRSRGFVRAWGSGMRTRLSSRIGITVAGHVRRVWLSLCFRSRLRLTSVTRRSARRRCMRVVGLCGRCSTALVCIGSSPLFGSSLRRSGCR